MNLYLISQTVNEDYDTFDSAVVAAPDENAAKLIHPDGLGEKPAYRTSGTWVAPEHVTVKLVGVAAPDTPQGVVCASFNAG